MSRLILQIMVGNEENRIDGILRRFRDMADKVLVLGDHPEDATPDICKKYTNVYYQESVLPKGAFLDARSCGMSRLREELWELTREHSDPGDWILALDADQLLGNRFFTALPYVLDLPYEWVGSRLLDLWYVQVPPDHKMYYRKDGYWSPLVTRLFRFADKPWGRPLTKHASNIPGYLDYEKSGVTFDDYTILHSGWLMSPEAKEAKRDFYLSIADPGSINHQHALSITKPPVLAPVELEDYKS